MRRRRTAPTGAAGDVTDIGYLGDFSIYKVRLDDGFVIEGRGHQRHARVERAITSAIGSGCHGRPTQAWC